MDKTHPTSLLCLSRPLRSHLPPPPPPPPPRCAIFILPNLFIFAYATRKQKQQAAAHLAKTGGTTSSARQAQRLRSICRAFFDECRSAEADGERGASGAAAASATAGSSSSSPSVAEGVRSRLHECAGFVAVLTLLLQPAQEWARSKRFVLVSSCFGVVLHMPLCIDTGCGGVCRNPGEASWEWFWALVLHEREKGTKKGRTFVKTRLF